MSPEMQKCSPTKRLGRTPSPAQAACRGLNMVTHERIASMMNKCIVSVYECSLSRALHPVPDRIRAGPAPNSVDCDHGSIRCFGQEADSGSVPSQYTGDVSSDPDVRMT